MRVRRFEIGVVGTPHDVVQVDGNQVIALTSWRDSVDGPVQQLRALTDGCSQVVVIVPDDTAATAFVAGRATALLPVHLDFRVAVADETSSQRDDEDGGVVASQAIPGPGRSAGDPPRPLPAADSVDGLQLQLKQEVWRFGQQSPAALNTRRALENHPAAPVGIEQAAERLVAESAADRAAFDEFCATAAKLGPDDDSIRPALERFVDRRRESRGFRRKVAEKELKYLRARAERNAVVTSTVRASGVEHRLWRMAPASSWTIVLDETGTFEEKANGRIVALAIPASVTLPPLTGFHAVTERNAGRIDEVVQIVVDNGVGVFGIEQVAAPALDGDPWLQVTIETLSWVLRLLPLDDRPGMIPIEVLIEQRGAFAAGDRWQAPAAAMLRQIADEDPRRARALALTIRIVDKSSPLNGYVDAVAFTWGSPTSHSECRLAQSGLLGRCLVPGDIRPLRAAWRSATTGQDFEVHAWRTFTRPVDIALTDSFAGAVAERLRQRCRDNVGAWRGLLALVEQHLDSKAIDLPGVGREVSFLTSCKPEGEVLSGALQLAYEVALLQQRNHEGRVAADANEGLDRLATRLVDECASLVCLADLARAVEATNRFSFAAADEAIGRWAGLPVQLPGLQMRGRLESTRGQLAAFRGDLAGAASRFDEALAIFSRLSDPVLAAREQGQTATYRAIVAIDDPSVARDTARAATSLVVTIDAPELSARSDDAFKYRLHLLWRWLATRATESEQRAALAHADGWSSGRGHPWPMIDAYRALVLGDVGDPRAAGQWAKAIAGTRAGGPTVRFIGLVLSLAAVRSGNFSAEDRRQEDERLRWQLAEAPWAEVDRVIQENPGSSSPRQILSACLPFNFR